MKRRDPLEVAALRGQGIVADAQDLANLVEQAWRSGARQLPQFEMQQFLIEEVQGVTAQGDGPHRVLVRLGHGLEELADLGQAQLTRVLFAVEEDEAAAAVGVRCHGRFGISALTCRLPQLVQQTRRWQGRGR